MKDILSQVSSSPPASAPAAPLAPALRPTPPRGASPKPPPPRGPPPVSAERVKSPTAAVARPMPSPRAAPPRGLAAFDEVEEEEHSALSNPPPRAAAPSATASRPVTSAMQSPRDGGTGARVKFADEEASFALPSRDAPPRLIGTTAVVSPGLTPSHSNNSSRPSTPPMQPAQVGYVLPPAESPGGMDDLASFGIVSLETSAIRAHVSSQLEPANRPPARPAPSPPVSSPQGMRPVPPPRF
jgi:flagellar protein FliO/FliZ